MADSTNAVSQKIGSIQLRIIFAFVLAHLWKRVFRSVRTSYVIIVIDLRHLGRNLVRVVGEIERDDWTHHDEDPDVHSAGY